MKSRASTIPSMTIKAATYTLARFAVDGPMLPPISNTLPLAEQVRRALLCICTRIVLRDNPGLANSDIWRLSPAFWGKDDQGRPLTGHGHAFFLPADEDGDGWLDHVTVIAPMGFNSLECQAIDRLRLLRFGDGDPLQLVLIGLGNAHDFRAPLLAQSAVWVSATPFVVTRFPKLRGSKRDRPTDYATPTVFAGHVLRQELARRSDLPSIVSIEDEEVIGPRGLRAIQFKRSRSRPGDDGGRRPTGAFRVTFAGPVHGPLCLGHSCHFGLGVFVPASPGAPRDER